MLLDVHHVIQTAIPPPPSSFDSAPSHLYPSRLV